MSDHANPSADPQHWWRDEVIYQIYPRSFADASGDGVGDLKGIEHRLDYLTNLGVDALWLSPIFKSPMRDFGYDVADYRAIDPLFGTMADFDRLLTAAHDRGLKLLLDFVPNHTSSEHAWFQQSRSSRDNPKRDWYIWRDPAPDGGPPNNWQSNFGGPAWTFDEASGQYYYHAFLTSQPDLNWRNREVRAAMFDVLRFWLDKGVDGFRVDVIWHLIKDAEFRDNPPNPDWQPGHSDIGRYEQVHSTNQPEVHDVIAEMRQVIDEYDARLLIGEIYLPPEELVSYYGSERKPEVHLPFNFQLVQCDWNARTIAALVSRYESLLPEGGWPNWVLSNHDQPRIAARVGKQNRQAKAKIAATLLLTLRGTPTIYYGDELGLADVTIPPDRIQDPWAKQEPDASFNRDRARTPMQWSGAANAGFSQAEPWLPLSEDWQTRNVTSLWHDDQSILPHHRALLQLRRRHPALRTGSYSQVLVDDGVFVFARELDGERLIVALNFRSEPRQIAADALPSQLLSLLEPLLSTHGPRETSQGGDLTLAPDEGVIFQVEGNPA